MAAPPHPHTPQGPPPGDAKTSQLVWWFLALLAIGVLVLGVGGMLIAGYVMRNVQVQESGSGVEIQTPVGEMKVDKDGANPGLPVYPGATLVDPGAAVEITALAEDALSVIAARYRTPDPLPKVDEWYQAQLGPDFRREGPGVMVRKKNIVGLEVKSSDVAFVAEDKELLRAVVLERKGIQTEIGLARIGRAETQ